MDCRPSNFNNLPNEVKALYKDRNDLADNFAVQCDFDGLTDIRVMTTHSYIFKALDDIKKGNVRDMYCFFLKKMVLYSQKDTDKIYAKQGKAWQNMCDDIVLYYCCRVVLFKKPIPVVEM
jgi:hypothetical protein